MKFVGEARRALVGELASEFDDVGWHRKPVLMCLEGPPGWGRTRIVRECYQDLARRQDYWPRSLGGGRHSVDPGDPERGGDEQPPWLWSGVRVVGGSAQHVLGAHADQLTARLELLLRTAARDRAVRRAVGTTAGFAAGYQFADLGSVISGAGALVGIAQAVGAQRDLSLAKSGRLASRAEHGGVGGERLIARVRDAEREELTVVLVFDDAHDASEGVCGFLQELLAGPMPVGVMCLCTARSDQMDGAFGSWLVKAETRFPDRVHRVPLARLSDADIADLVVDHAPHTSGDRARALVERADGNALVLEALVDAAQQLGGVKDKAITLASDAIGALPNYEETLRNAWSNTEPSVREVLSMASAQGRTFLSGLATTGWRSAGLLGSGQSSEASLLSAVKRGLWISDVGEVLVFREQYGFEFAQDWFDQMLPKLEQREALYVGLTEEITRWKANPQWEALSDQVKVMLLSLHVELAEKCPTQPPGRVDHASVAESAEQLARCELQLGEPRTALLDFEKAAEHAARLTLVHPAALIARGNLAVATYLFGSPTDSIHLLQAALEEHERVLGSRHPDTVTAAANLGIALYDAYKYAEAIGLQRWVLSESENVLGGSHPETIAARVNLAATLGDAGHLVEAITLQHHVIADLTRLLGAEDPETWIARGALARSLTQQGQLKEAITIFVQLVAYYGRMQGKHGAATLTSRGNLANAYQAAGDLRRAIPLYEQTLADTERVLGPEHPNTLTSRVNLANACRAAGDLGRAIPLFERTVEDMKRVLGPGDPRTLGSRIQLARAYASAGDLGRAIPLFEQTLADKERVLGREHPDTLTSRVNLADAYAEAGDLGRAMPLYEQTVPDMERVLGPEHPHTLTSRGHLANAYRAAGDLARAIPLYEQALAEQERLLGPEHPDTLTSRVHLAGAYRAAGDLGRAIPLYEQTVADMERVSEIKHPHTLTSRNNLATAYAAAGDFGRAIPLLEQTLADKERVLGAEHPDTLMSRANLASVRKAASDIG